MRNTQEGEIKERERLVWSKGPLTYGAELPLGPKQGPFWTKRAFSSGTYLRTLVETSLLVSSQ